MRAKKRKTATDDATDPAARMIKAVKDSAPPQPNGTIQLQQMDTTPSVVGTGLTFVGDLTNRGELLIEGTVEGEVNGGRVDVGVAGRIVGNIEADEVIISGALVGCVYANVLLVRGGAKLSGDVYCAQIQVDGGATITGYCYSGEDYDSKAAPNNVYKLSAAE